MEEDFDQLQIKYLIELLVQILESSESSIVFR